MNLIPSEIKKIKTNGFKKGHKAWNKGCKMQMIPFGTVVRENVDISKKYKLIESVNGIWRLTTKCKDNYQPESYVKYLRGDVEKPTKIADIKPIAKPVVKTNPKPKLTPQQEMRTKEYQDAVNELFKL